MHADVLPLDAYRRRRPPAPDLIRSIRDAGSVSLAGDQSKRRNAAAKLAIAGIVSIEEIRADGSSMPLTPADVLLSHSANAWRVSLKRSG